MIFLHTVRQIGDDFVDAFMDERILSSHVPIGYYSHAIPAMISIEDIFYKQYFKRGPYSNVVAHDIKSIITFWQNSAYEPVQCKITDIHSVGISELIALEKTALYYAHMPSITQYGVDPYNFPSQGIVLAIGANKEWMYVDTDKFNKLQATNLSHPLHIIWSISVLVK